VKRLIIFDFDGVLADSELLANGVLADILSELGVPTTVDDSLRLYMGKRLTEIISAAEAAVGPALPTDFVDHFQRRTLERLRGELRLVAGAREYLQAFAEVPRCIASSSSPDRLLLCLEVLGLAEQFGTNVFSAVAVPRGKPHPDIFHYAAERMRVPPAECLVIEDSVGGVQAAVSAGITVIGLLAGSHIQGGHAQRLEAAGADYVASSFVEAETITRALLT
jgi:HAD superfamily hydrolase (TIGR01509 family)